MLEPACVPGSAAAGQNCSNREINGTRALRHFRSRRPDLDGGEAQNRLSKRLRMTKIAQTFSAWPSRMGLAAGRRGEEETDPVMRHLRWHSNDLDDPECRPGESDRRQSLVWLKREFCIPCGTPSSP